MESHPLFWASVRASETQWGDTMPTSDPTNSSQNPTVSPSRLPVSRRSMLSMLGVGGLGALSGVGSARRAGDAAGADGDPADGELRGAPDPSRPLIAHDAATADLEGDGPTPNATRNLSLAGRGERLVAGATTDVWAHDGYAYLGTFDDPCGTGDGFGEDALVDDLEGPGVAVFDVRNPTSPAYVGSLPSVEGSRINDVKVADLNAGTILVHSNEPCDGGPGGFELYDVDDPENPTHLASVRTDDGNPFLRDAFGFTDFGVHNLFLFTQGERDYVAAVVESLLGNFQLFDITDPEDPQLVGTWGAEQLATDICDAECQDSLYDDLDDVGLILDLQAYLFDGFGSSRNRFLHDVTVSEDGTRAYLANWDAGLVLLDIGDPTDPQLVSVALEQAAGNGEVNSHQAWPSADGSIVVETEEDFDPFELTFEIASGPNAGAYDAAEGAFTTPIFTLPDRTMTGSTAYLGLACDAESIPEASGPGEIAVIQRGACRFDEKAQNAIDAGYDGMVVFNDAARGDDVIIMGGESRDIPGVFVGHATGLAIFDVASAEDLSVGDTGADIEATAEPQRWGNVRIWDYSDEANPALASEFDTRCSFDPIHEDCDPRGTYSVHNAIVEGDRAYLSWYSDGVLVLDIGDPAEPVEVARYSPGGDEFEAQNGGIQDVWGIYKEPRRPWIYASDRNGGLYVLQLRGSGSGKRGG